MFDQLQYNKMPVPCFPTICCRN